MNKDMSSSGSLNGWKVGVLIIQKWAKDHTNGQQAHAKMVNVTNN